MVKHISPSSNWLQDYSRSSARHVPVKGRKRAESHTSIESSDHAQRVVVRCDPGHPVESVKFLEERVGDPKVDKHEAEGEEEEVISRNLPTVDGFSPVWNDQGSVQSELGQDARPHGLWWIDDDSSNETSEREAEGLHGQGDEDLVSPSDPRQVEEYW